MKKYFPLWIFVRVLKQLRSLNPLLIIWALCTIFFFSKKTSAQWSICYASDNVITSIYFIDSLNGYATAEGSILKTIDGGLSWSATAIDNYKWLSSISFSNKDTGYAVGENGLVVQTIDGGLNWNILSTTINFSLYSVYFFSGREGVVSCQGPYLARTSDAFQTYQLELLPHLYDITKSITFSTWNEGYLIGTDVGGSGGKIFKTSDHGNNWFPTDFCNATEELFFLNKDTGFTIGAAFGRRTFDGGNNWEDINIGSVFNDLSDIFMTSDKDVFAVGQDGDTKSLILKSTDGGYSWYSQIAPHDSLNFYTCIYCVDDSLCFAGSTNGDIVKTTNGGGETGIKQVTRDLLSIFPNPATASFEITYPLTHPTTLTITNTCGIITKQLTLSPANRSTIISVDDLPAGVYLVTLLDGEKRFSKKLVIAR